VIDVNTGFNECFDVANHHLLFAIAKADEIDANAKVQ